MNNPFEILAGFLEKHAGEVEGRSLEEPPIEVKTQLREFARGRLPEVDQGKLFQLLKEKPQWISLLAEEARAARTPDGLRQ